MKKQKEKHILTNQQGFTLAELLVVVAIIGILVAISVPVFAAQLERSREQIWRTAALLMPKY